MNRSRIVLVCLGCSGGDLGSGHTIFVGCGDHLASGVGSCVTRTRSGMIGHDCSGVPISAAGRRRAERLVAV